MLASLSNYLGGGGGGGTWLPWQPLFLSLCSMTDVLLCKTSNMVGQMLTGKSLIRLPSLKCPPFLPISYEL